METTNSSNGNVDPQPQVQVPQIQVPQEQSELQEPKEKVNASPNGLIISSILIVVIFWGGYNVYAKQSKQSPNAKIVQIQMEMQKIEGEKIAPTVKEKKSETVETVKIEEEVKIVVPLEIVKTEEEAKIVEPLETVKTEEEAKIAEPLETVESKENNSELSDTLGASVIQLIKR